MNVYKKNNIDSYLHKIQNRIYNVIYNYINILYIIYNKRYITEVKIRFTLDNGCTSYV